MELIYLWSKEYKNLKDIGYNFSPNFDVNFRDDGENKYLSIKKLNHEFHIFKENEKLKNVTAIIGKNGSGKTNILNLLGVRRDERVRINHQKDVDYFLIYHYQNDLFVIEGNNFSYIKPLLRDVEKLDFVSDTYSIIFKYENLQFYCLNFLQHNDEIHNSNILFSYRSNFDREIAAGSSSFELDSEYTVFFNRCYLTPQYTGHLAKYKMLIDFNNNVKNKEDLNLNIFKFAHPKNHLIIQPDIHSDSKFKLDLKKKFNSGFRIIGEENESPFKPKEHYINKLAYSICQSVANWVFDDPNEIKNFEHKFNIVEESYTEYCLKIILILLEYRKQKDPYFNDKEVMLCFREYIGIMKKFEESYFSEDKILIPTYTQADKNVIEFLHLLNLISKLDGYIQSFVKVFSISYSSLSSGEEALISLFSALHHGLTQNILSQPKHVILLLDEPDNFMHPEWSRILLNELIKFLNTIDTEYQSFQIILSTHSPFIISDLPAENVIALEKEEISGDCYIAHLGKTFANNIHSLLSEEFFISSTLGEYAKNKINEVIELIISPKELTKGEKAKIEYFISIIGEPLIKNKLRSMMNQRSNKK